MRCGRLIRGQNDISVRQPGVCRSIRRILYYGALEVIDTSLDVRNRSAVPVKPTAQIELENFRIFNVVLRNALCLGAAKPLAQTERDPAGDLVFKYRELFEFALVFLSPDLISCSGVNQIYAY